MRNTRILFKQQIYVIAIFDQFSLNSFLFRLNLYVSLCLVFNVQLSSLVILCMLCEFRTKENFQLLALIGLIDLPLHFFRLLPNTKAMQIEMKQRNEERIRYKCATCFHYICS